MTRLLPVVLFLAACSGPGGLLPDGGRPRIVCQNNFTRFQVRAQDAMGVPISGANVTARNASSGLSEMSQTGGDGTTFFSDDLGNGMIEVSAASGALATKQPFVVQILCGECDCTIMPSSVTLTLE